MLHGSTPHAHRAWQYKATATGGWHVVPSRAGLVRRLAGTTWNRKSGIHDNCRSSDTTHKLVQAVKRTTIVSVVTIGSTGATLTSEKLRAKEPVDPSQIGHHDHV
jgi:hypothetical protein